MLKLTAIVSLVLIATWSQAESRRHKKDASEPSDSGSTMWAASLSCDSCGSECTSACGTRHFRSCCFNYLRKKRVSDIGKITPQSSIDLKSQEMSSKSSQSKLPVFLVENIPDQWISNVVPNEYRPYPYEDMYENRFFDV